MPRTKGSKNRPKTTRTDYASQIAEKQESITSLEFGASGTTEYEKGGSGGRPPESSG